MKANELYALTPIDTSDVLHRMLGQFPEIDEYRLPDNQGPVEGLVIKYYANHSFDAERSWTLASIWYKDMPFLILQEAGRGGKDYSERFITNLKLYKEVVAVLLDLYADQDIENTDCLDPEYDISYLDSFYNCNLSSFYNPDLKPKYKVGEIVMAFVTENHLAWKSRKVLTRVHIKVVNKFHPEETYWGLQLDRRWGDGPINNRTMIEDIGNGTMGATFKDAEVESLIGFKEVE